MSTTIREQTMHAGVDALEALFRKIANINDQASLALEAQDGTDDPKQNYQDAIDYAAIAQHIERTFIENLNQPASAQREGFLRALAYLFAGLVDGDPGLDPRGWYPGQWQPLKHTANAFAKALANSATKAERLASLQEGQMQFKAMKARALELETSTWDDTKDTSDYAVVTAHVESVVMANLLNADQIQRQGFMRTMAYILVCEECGMSPSSDFDVIAATAASFPQQDSPAYGVVNRTTGNAVSKPFPSVASAVCPRKEIDPPDKLHHNVAPSNEPA